MGRKASMKNPPVNPRAELDKAQAEQSYANALLVRAQAIRQLRDAGYDPDSVVSAVVAADLSLLRNRA